MSICWLTGWLVGWFTTEVLTYLNSCWMGCHRTLHKHSRSSEEQSDTPFCDQVGSGAGLEPVPTLEPGLCILHWYPG